VFDAYSPKHGNSVLVGSIGETGCNVGENLRRPRLLGRRCIDRYILLIFRCHYSAPRHTLSPVYRKAKVVICSGTAAVVESGLSRTPSTILPPLPTPPGGCPIFGVQGKMALPPNSWT